MRTGTICLKLVAAATLVLTVSAAWAQPQGQGRRGGFGRMFGGGATDPTVLLTQESVQKELELTDEQKTKATKLSEDYQQAFQGIMQGVNFPPSDEDRQAIRKKMDELIAQDKKKVADVLVPKQQTRLDEIAVQYSIDGGFFPFAAASALQQDDLAKKLEITEDQKGKLQQIADDGQQKMQELGFPPDPDQSAKLRTELKDKTMGVLTDDQKKKLETMEGKKFDVSTIQIFGGRGGFRGGRGRGGAGGAGGAGPGA